MLRGADERLYFGFGAGEGLTDRRSGVIYKNDNGENEARNDL